MKEVLLNEQIIAFLPCKYIYAKGKNHFQLYKMYFPARSLGQRELSNPGKANRSSEKTFFLSYPRRANDN